VAVTPPRPLAEGDDRNLFDCGRESLNTWFRRHAWANQTSGASRVNVITDAASGRIVGYVTLSAAQIERAFLPRPQQRNRPDPVPVTLLGQLAVDKDYQGQGHAASLLLFALKTALTAAESIGSVGVVTHPLDDNVRRFYARWGFQDLPFDPRRAMVVRMVDLQRVFGDEIEPRGVRSPVRDVEL
jgi:GNAT superfamily N-acetyltransferase